MHPERAISVIIPVYQGGERLKRCIEALAATTPPPMEVIVVCDGSDEDVSYAQRLCGATILKTPVQSGPARARNRGAREAQGALLFFLDADVVIRPDAFERIMALFAEDPELAAVFGSYDDAPSEPNFLSQYRNLLHHYVHQTGNADASTFWGACGAIRRDVFQAVGGFDERRYRRPSIEDIELGYRLKQAGYTIRLCKTLQVKHLKRWEARSMLKTDVLHRALPWTELILRHRNLINDLNTDTTGRLSVLSSFILIGALLLSVWYPVLAVLAAVAAGALLWLNLPLYRFFRGKRGWWFTLKTIPWHWFYYFYSGLAFLAGFIRFHLPS